MQNNIIKKFLTQYGSCPICGCSLQMIAKYSSTSHENHEFILTIQSSKITIIIRTNYFVSSSNKNFEFSLDIIDGNIIYSRSMNEFVSLYDLDIILSKECGNIACRGREDNESLGKFYQSINIYYSRPDSAFTADLWEDWLGVSANKEYYEFCNNFHDKTSYILIYNYATKQDPFHLKVPFIPFEKFNFQSKETLMTKIDSIRLLA